MNKDHKKNILLIAVLSMLMTFAMVSCVTQKDKPSNPPGYDLDSFTKFGMPDVLQEISGIAFNKGDSSFVFAQQDEDGKLFKLPLGSKEKIATKFASKGDYEDVTIINDWVIMLKSNGDLFSFPISEINNPEATNVIETKKIVPKGEYEGLFADEASGKVYVLCKECKEDKKSKLTSVYVLTFQPEGSFKADTTFKIDAGQMDNLTGKKKGTFHPSALAINPLTKEWYVVSSVNKALVVLDQNWQVKNVYHLSSNTFNQPEGIAFDKAGNLYISNEGSETQLGNILRFNYKKP